MVERQLSWKVKGHTQKKRKKKRNLTNIQARRRWRVTSPVSHKNIKQLQQNDNQCKIILPDWSVNIKRKITQWPRVEVEDFIYLIIYFFHLTSFRFSTVQFFTHTHNHIIHRIMGKCAFIAPKIRKFLSLLHVCCIKEIAEEEWMKESVATITSSSPTTIKTLYMLHVTPFMLHLFRSSVSQ